MINRPRGANCQLVALRVFSTHVPGRPRLSYIQERPTYWHWILGYWFSDDFVLQMDFFFRPFLIYLYVRSLRIELYYIAAGFSSLMLVSLFPTFGTRLMSILACQSREASANLSATCVGLGRLYIPPPMITRTLRIHLLDFVCFACFQIPLATTANT